MLAHIAQIGLFFNQPTTWATLGLFGFLWLNRPIFGRALLITLFTLIYNVTLKALWQEPLLFPLEGWAFPSGHMHSAWVFWGALAIGFHRVWFSAFIFLILCLGAYGLVYSGYHYPRDIVGAVGFGSLSLLVFFGLAQLRWFKAKPYLLGVVLIAVAGVVIALTPTIGIKSPIYQGMGGLIGLTLGWGLLQHQAALDPKPYWLTGIQIGVIILGLWLINLAVDLIPMTQFNKIAIFSFIGILWVLLLPYALRYFSGFRHLLRR